MDFVNDTVVSDAKAITVIEAGHLFHAHSSWIFGQFIESVVQSLLQSSVPDFPQRFFHRRTDFQLIAAHAQPNRLRASLHGIFSPGSSSARFAASLSRQFSSRCNCSSTKR